MNQPHTPNQPEQLEKLIKVLGLTSSDHDGEALAALRQAKQMLFSQGLSLPDLAALLASNTQAEKPRRALDISRSLRKAYELKLARAEHENARLQKELRQAASALQQWQNLARTTANHLWELGQQLQALDQPTGSPPDALNGAADNVIAFQKPAL